MSRTTRRPVRRAVGVRRGFSLVDVLVSMAVIAVLIGLLLPTISVARESARRVVCASNVRQIGIGIGMYGDDWQDRLPLSVFVTPMGSNFKRNMAPNIADTIALRLGEPGLWRSPWDGLGRLYAGEYLEAKGVFYCPSHSGPHTRERYEDAWLDQTGEIAGNYQYRGRGPNGSTFISTIEPRRSALVSDAMFVDGAAAANHDSGFNLLRSDISVSFVNDNGSLYSSLAVVQGGGAGSGGGSAWETLDRFAEDPGNGPK